MKRTLCLAAILTAIASILAPRVATQSDPAVQGQWSSTQLWPYRAIHAALLPNGQVLFWDSYDLADNARLWNPSSGAIANAAKAGYNIFCTGFATMTDGRLFMAGGHVADNVGLAYAAIYTPSTNSWSRLPDMNAGRWYPTVTNLPNGELLVLSGVRDTSVGMNLLPQVWQPAAGSWRNLTNAQLQLPFYPFAHLAPDGRVFYAGPGQLTRYLNTSGTGAWSTVANSIFGTRNWGSSVMYEPGRVLITGGSKCAPYDAGCANVTATSETIDLNVASPVWRQVGSMAQPRKQHNLTLLPDGRVLATGGSSGALGFDDETSPVLNAEVWTPATAQWTVWASGGLYRGYHATALLLPDGRVLQAGGNKGGASAEIFSPPYLFKGARPSIASAPTSINHGQTFLVGTPDAASITQVTLVRPGAVTHSFNMTQRFNRLSFSVTTGGVNVVAPANANLAPPGDYMLFLLNGAGVPSVARVVRLTVPPAPPPPPPPPPTTPAAPTNLTASSIGSGAIQLRWSDNSTNESGFRMERCPGSACTNFATIASIAANATGYRDNNASPGQTYRYRALAWNAAGVSGYSNIASATARR